MKVCKTKYLKWQKKKKLNYKPKQIIIRTKVKLRTKYSLKVCGPSEPQLLIKTGLLCHLKCNTHAVECEKMMMLKMKNDDRKHEEYLRPQYTTPKPPWPIWQ